MSVPVCVCVSVCLCVWFGLSYIFVYFRFLGNAGSNKRKSSDSSPKDGIRHEFFIHFLYIAHSFLLNCVKVGRGAIKVYIHNDGTVSLEVLFIRPYERILGESVLHV